MNKRWKLALICAAPIWAMAIYCIIVADPGERLKVGSVVAGLGVFLALIIGFTKAHTRDD